MIETRTEVAMGVGIDVKAMQRNFLGVMEMCFVLGEWGYMGASIYQNSSNFTLKIDHGV